MEGGGADKRLPIAMRLSYAQQQLRIRIILQQALQAAGLMVMVKLFVIYKNS